MSASLRVALPGSEASLSRLAAGCWRLREQTKDNAGAVHRYIEYCLSLGITTFDHADIYGSFGVEALFGRALAEAPGLRARIELVTKCSIAPVHAAFPRHRALHLDASAAYLAAAVERSLRALNTDRLDLVLIHRPDLLMDADDAAAGMEKLKRAGKVRAFGVSNFSASQFALLQDRLSFPLAANQIELSVLKTDALTDGTLDDAQRRRIVAMYWSPLGGGRLFAGPAHEELRTVLAEVARRHGVSVAALAVAWLLRLPAANLPVLGTADPQRLSALAASRNVALDRQDWYAIYSAAGKSFA